MTGREVVSNLYEPCLRVLLISSGMTGREVVSNLYEVGRNFVENNRMYGVIMKITTHKSDHLPFFLEIMMKLSEIGLK